MRCAVRVSFRPQVAGELRPRTDTVWLVERLRSEFEEKLAVTATEPLSFIRFENHRVRVLCCPHSCSHFYSSRRP